MYTHVCRNRLTHILFASLTTTLPQCNTASNQLTGSIPKFKKPDSDILQADPQSSCKSLNFFKKIGLDWFREISTTSSTAVRDESLIYLKSLSLCKSSLVFLSMVKN